LRPGGDHGRRGARQITSRGFRDGKAMFSGRITEIIERRINDLPDRWKLSGQWVLFSGWQCH